MALLRGLASAVIAIWAIAQPQFRSRVDLVQVDVVVTDSKGNPVSGLTADDFTIHDKGRAQTISQFAPYYIPLGERRVERGAPPVVNDVVTNAEPLSPRALVILIDSLHLTTDAEELERTRRALMSILTDAAATDDVAIVFTVRSDLSVPFTRDLSRQMRAIDNIRAGAVPRVVRPIREAGKAVEASLWTVRNAIAILRGSQYSRRVLLYVGEGSILRPEPPSPVYDEVRMTVEAATRAGVVIHAIDPRGVLESSEYQAQRKQRDFLSALVLDTGGSVIASAADTRGEIKKVMRQNGTFYVLGFVPDPLPADGGFRDIEVTVKRPGLRVSARKGYYPATRRAEEPDVRTDPARALESALESGIAARDVTLTVVASPEAIAPGGDVTLLMTIAIGAGAAQPAAGWDLALAALTPDGKVLATTSEHVPAVGTTGSVTIQHRVNLRPGIRPVRLVARNRDTGAVGALHVPLEIPDIEDAAVVVGDIMLGSSKDGGFEPAVERTFSTSSPRVLKAHVFWDGKTGEVVPVTATISHDGKTVESTAAKLTGLPMGRRVVAPFTWDLPLGRLPSGTYVVTVTAARGGKRATHSVPFVVR